MTVTAVQQRHVELVARVAGERDRAAFETLFDFYAPRLNGYLQKLGLEAQQAEDIAQDVMIVLWHKAHLFDHTKSSLATWLFRIARNRRIDLIRRMNVRKFDQEDPFLLPDEVEQPDDQLADATRDERVRAAIDKLPEEQMQLLRFAFFTGLSHSQISEKTGLPLGTVKSRIRLSFAKLKVLLEADPRVDTL